MIDVGFQGFVEVAGYCLCYVQSITQKNSTIFLSSKIFMIFPGSLIVFHILSDAQFELTELTVCRVWHFGGLY